MSRLTYQRLAVALAIFAVVATIAAHDGAPAGAAPVLAEEANAASPEPAPAPAEADAPPRPSGWRALLGPFVGPLVAPPRQVHPILVHFPIVLLLLEAGFLLRFRIRGRAEDGAWAFRCLASGAACLVPVALAGLHDAGLDRGEGNVFLLGLHDRWTHALRLSSPLTVHVWIIGALASITLARLILRIRERRRGAVGSIVWVEGALGLLGLWCLIAAAYVGGELSHR